MKITGVAPQIAIPTFAFLALAGSVQYLTRPFFSISKFHYTGLVVLAVILILAGLIMVAAVGRKLIRAYQADMLMTDGLYKVFRNPMYSAYLLFIIPGIVLLINSWLAFAAIILNFILFRILIRKEHKYLNRKHGMEYQRYLKKVWFKFL